MPLKLARLHARLLISGGLGLAVILASFAVPWRLPTRLLAGWNVGAAFYLVLTGWMMARATVTEIRRRAAIHDEGARALLALTAAAALASLVAILAELGHVPGAPGGAGWYGLALGMGTILLSWLFMHTIFALHYAHEFYGSGRGARMGGLEFPGQKEPDYWDFLYFSLVIAMTSQVSDVAISSKTIRRIATAHGALGFFFNLSVLALTVNMVSNLMNPGH